MDKEMNGWMHWWLFGRGQCWGETHQYRSWHHGIGNYRIWLQVVICRSFSGMDSGEQQHVSHSDGLPFLTAYSPLGSLSNWPHMAHTGTVCLWTVSIHTEVFLCPPSLIFPSQMYASSLRFNYSVPVCLTLRTNCDAVGQFAAEEATMAVWALHQIAACISVGSKSAHPTDMEPAAPSCDLSTLNSLILFSPLHLGARSFCCQWV